MRMWNVNPKIMCRKHLLAEHFETHCFVGHILRGKKYQGFLDNGMLETHNIKTRHDILASEMEDRGFKHNTPLTFSYDIEEGKIDVENNINVLYHRCPYCRERIERIKNDKH